VIEDIGFELNEMILCGQMLVVNLLFLIDWT